MKKICANLLVVPFVLMIVGSASRAGIVGPATNFSETLGRITGVLLMVAGLYYSAKWSLKLSGHTYKVGWQTVATIVFWYSLFAAFVGLIMPFYARNTFGFKYAVIMVVVWSTVAYVSKRWQQRLRRIERNRLIEAATAQSAS
jgi:hypothetical protein